jgi:hypothetical protein
MSQLDDVRSDVLARIDRAERNYKLAFAGAVAVEGFFLLAFLFLADFTNRMHVLLLLASVMTYSTLAIGLVALGAHLNRGILRVLQAVACYCPDGGSNVSEERRKGSRGNREAKQDGDACE